MMARCAHSVQKVEPSRRKRAANSAALAGGASRVTLALRLHNFAASVGVVEPIAVVEGED